MIQKEILLTFTRAELSFRLKFLKLIIVPEHMVHSRHPLDWALYIGGKCFDKLVLPHFCKVALHTCTNELRLCIL